MSMALDTQTKSVRGTAADSRAIAQVEKWMAMIREINREQTKN
jgi:hypothetical protein